MIRRFPDDACALVTGAGGGIGRSIVQRLLAEDVAVIATDADSAALKTLVADVADRGHLTTIVGDVTDPELRTALVAAAQDEHGRLDVLINNAGIMLGRGVTKITEADWDRAHDVNAKAAFFLTQAAIPLLRASAGAIVNQSSILAVRAGSGLAAYTASKASVIGTTLALAVDLAPHGIRVNALCPGSIDTPMPWTLAARAFGPDDTEAAERSFVARQLIKRLGRPDEVAAAAVFLASQDASFITGVAVPVDGGWSAW